MDKPQSHEEERRDVEARLLTTLERLLQLDATNVTGTLNAAAHLVGEALNAEKVDAFLYHPENQTLQVAGLSNTPMSRHEVAIGLDRLTIADGGRLVEVFQTGELYATGHADQDPLVRKGITEGLGIRSLIAVVLEMGGERRGLLQVASAREEAFSEQDQAFFSAVATWIGLLLHRAELVEQLTASAAEAGKRVAADELISVLAHDLRNLLSPVSLRLQLLRRRFEQEQRPAEAGDIQQVLASVGRLNGLIRNLLDTARLEHGLFAIEPQECDLTALARESAALLSTPTTPIDVHAAADVIVQGDPERLRQVMENLLGNAIQHSPTGARISVTIEVERHAASGTIQSTRATRGARRTPATNTTPAAVDWAIVVIQDQGEGIPPELMPRLFERYVRGEESRGIGLGLYVSSRIAEAHDGTLTAESEPGQGARFILRLPLVATS